MSPLRVLLVDDDADDVQLTSEVLRECFGRSCDIQVVSAPDLARERMASVDYDVCLVDYRLGGEDGVQLVREAVQAGHAGPFILLTGLDQRDVDVEAMKAGAADYLVKRHLTAALLERSIRYSIEAIRTQGALRESERRLREIAENVRDVFWVWDARAGRLTYLNAAFDRVFGRSHEIALAEPQAALSWIPSADRPIVAQQLQQLAAGRESDGEFRVGWPDGTERYVHARGFPVRDAAGTITRMVGTLEDITTRRRAERGQDILAAAGRIKGRSLDLQTTLDAIVEVLVPAFADSCAIDVLDAEGQLARRAYKFANPDREAAALELHRRFPLGDRPEHPVWKVIGTGQSFFLPELTPDMVTLIARDPEEMVLARRACPASCIFAALQTGTRVLGVLTLSTDPGRQRYDTQDVVLAEELARRGAAAIENAQLYQQAQEAEARERAQAERAGRLADASRRFAEAEFEPTLLRTIAEFIAEAGDAGVVWLLDAQGLHLELAALVDRRQHRMLDAPPPRRSRDSEPFVHVLSGGVVVTANGQSPEQLEAVLPGSARIEAPGADGAYVLAPLRVRGQAFGVLGVVHRAGTTRFAGDLMSSMLQELADRAAMAIDNARLFQASQRAVKARENLIAVVSHDVVSPLNVILMNTTLLIEGQDQEAPRALQMIRRAGERATRIVRDLLDSSVVESGRLAVTPATVEAAPLVDEGCEPFEHIARARRINLERGSMPQVRVLADAGRITQVLNNLIGNAVKFSAPGGRVLVSGELHGHHLRVSVQDSGPGIDESLLAKVFEPFYQVDPDDRRGVGLGLAIAKAIVEAHGGRIWVESAPGRGATFHFTVPLAIDSGQTPRYPSPSPTPVSC